LNQKIKINEKEYNVICKNNEILLKENEQLKTLLASNDRLIQDLIKIFDHSDSSIMGDEIVKLKPIKITLEKYGYSLTKDKQRQKQNR